jgi:hypothetical protein
MSWRTRCIQSAAIVLAFSTGVRAQDPYNLSSPVKHLATIFTDLYGPNGLIVDSEATLPGEQPHTAHFNNDFQSNFGKFGTAMVSQFVAVPLPSPASGFTFHFDPTTGVFQRSTQSFGPILAERADTIGAHRISVGFATQRFTFDTVEGIDLNQVPAVFTHDNAQLLGGRQDVVTTQNAISVAVNQFTTFVTIGISDRFDVSLAVPIVSTSMEVVSNATIQRLGTTNPLTHFFRQADGSVGNQRIFTAIGAASGLGDLTVRLKTSLGSLTAPRFAVGMDLRLPTGDALNLLGTGTTGVQPFVIWSTTAGAVSPHVNLSYQWNGTSVLAGNPATGEAADFPDQAVYTVGMDVNANRRLTLAFDLLGRYFINAERISAQPFHALDGVSVFPDVTFSQSSFNTLNGAAGFKLNIADRLLLDANVLFALDNHGVRDKVTPLIGFEYSF